MSDTLTFSQKTILKFSKSQSKILGSIAIVLLTAAVALIGYLTNGTGDVIILALVYAGAIICIEPFCTELPSKYTAERYEYTAVGMFFSIVIPFFAALVVSFLYSIFNWGDPTFAGFLTFAILFTIVITFIWVAIFCAYVDDIWKYQPAED